MRTLCVLAVLLPMSTACAKKPAATAAGAAPDPGRVSESAANEDGMIKQEVDLDGDGRTDVVNLYRERADHGRVQVEKQIDLNLDGKMDVISQFDEAGALETERIDRDFDGVFDWTDHYKDGIRVMAEMDNTFDGRSDTWFYYVTVEGRPRIDRKERDTNADGRIDFWERFDEAGNVMRTGRDIDGDGTMDERDQ
jgi:hypothetical protein